MSFRDSGHNFYSSSRRLSHFSRQKTVHVKEGKCKTVLSYHLTARGVTCHHAVADADHLITKVAIESATKSFTVVNAEDTEVLILLLHMTPDNTKDIFFVPHIPQQVKWTKRRQVWPIQDVQCRLGRELCQRLLFIRAFSGCVTTARPYGMGRGTILS